MNAETHPDPFQDAMGHGLQRAVQVTSCAVTAAQVYIHQQRSQAMATAERDERARRALAAQIRAEREAARVGWAPALDPAWLSQADLYQAAYTWGQAMPYADRSVPWYQPAAATAMRKCEERLRDLHPYAMARYDRLRGDGMGPADAMREAAPLFARPARTHDARYAPRPVLEAGTGENPTWATPGPEPSPGEATAVAAAEAQERRGRKIITALQARAHAQHRGPLGEAEQHTVLEIITNLPADIIDRVVRPDTPAGTSRQGATAEANSIRTQAAAARTARPWEHDFPASIQTVVATATSPPQDRPTAPASSPGRRPGRGDRPRP
jgi:hypothetical protein